ncbi:MAG: SPOR domain-containing protein [Pseudomonadota bacterium]
MHGTDEELKYRFRAPDEDEREDQRDDNFPQSALALDEEERLPWLESADDEDDYAGVDTARLLRFVMFGVALLIAIVGALWFFSHYGNQSQVAEGGVIKAPAQPYKQAPADVGGKTFAGTGDSAFAVSEGKSPAPKLGGAEAAVPAVAGSADADGAPAPAGAAQSNTGIGVQVGAYSSQITAEAGWTRLSGQYDALKGVNHRVVEGTADIGTVYRLQAVVGNLAAANALCTNLKAAGAACQVKR